MAVGGEGIVFDSTSSAERYGFTIQEWDNSNPSKFAELKKELVYKTEHTLTDWGIETSKNIPKVTYRFMKKMGDNSRRVNNFFFTSSNCSLVDLHIYPKLVQLLQCDESQSKHVTVPILIQCQSKPEDNQSILLKVTRRHSDKPFPRYLIRYVRKESAETCILQYFNEGINEITCVLEEVMGSKKVGYRKCYQFYRDRYTNIDSLTNPV